MDSCTKCTCRVRAAPSPGPGGCPRALAVGTGLRRGSRAGSNRSEAGIGRGSAREGAGRGLATVPGGGGTAGRGQAHRPLWSVPEAARSREGLSVQHKPLGCRSLPRTAVGFPYFMPLGLHHGGPDPAGPHLSPSCPPQSWEALFSVLSGRDKENVVPEPAQGARERGDLGPQERQPAWQTVRAPTGPFNPAPAPCSCFKRGSQKRPFPCRSSKLFATKSAARQRHVPTRPSWTASAAHPASVSVAGAGAAAAAGGGGGGGGSAASPRLRRLFAEHRLCPSVILNKTWLFQVSGSFFVKHRLIVPTTQG